MIEIELEKKLPQITMNFAEVKASLIAGAEKYKGILVTEDGLKDCKAMQRELAGTRNKLDSYRKEVKKEMLKPIDTFENQCKELIGLVIDVEIPIKENIAIFDQKKRDEKRLIAEEYISKTAIDQGLNEKYANQLTVMEKYCNLTAKITDTKADIEQRTFILLQEQIREAELIRLQEEREADAKVEAEKRMIEAEKAEEKRKRDVLEIAVDVVKEANKLIKEQLTIDDFLSLIGNGASGQSVMREINRRKDSIIQKEKPIVQTVEVKENDPELEKVMEQAEKAVAEVIYFIEMRVEGTIQEITELSHFLKDNNFNYQKLKTGLI